jgi:NitT/TauT family transport system substrate-binding protein
MTSRWREANPQTYKAVLAAIMEANELIAKNPRQAAEIFLKIEPSSLSVDFIEKLIRDPEFSYEPAPRNVMKIYGFMHRVGTLKTMPKTWQDLFFAEAARRQRAEAPLASGRCYGSGHSCTGSFECMSSR